MLAEWHLPIKNLTSLEPVSWYCEREPRWSMVHHTLYSDATVTRGKCCEWADCSQHTWAAANRGNRVCAFHKAISNMWEKIGQKRSTFWPCLILFDWFKVWRSERITISTLPHLIHRPVCKYWYTIRKVSQTRHVCTPVSVYVGLLTGSGAGPLLCGCGATHSCEYCLIQDAQTHLTPIDPAIRCE